MKSIIFLQESKQSINNKKYWIFKCSLGFQFCKTKNLINKRDITINKE